MSVGDIILLSIMGFTVLSVYLAAGGLVFCIVEDEFRRIQNGKIRVLAKLLFVFVWPITPLFILISGLVEFFKTLTEDWRE